jgi:phospholipid transport system substrate-binding protein
MAKTIIRPLFFLLCSLCFATAAQAYTPTALPPDRVVQGMIDDLDKVMKTRRAELEKNRQATFKVIDDVVLPHFDLDYASILMLGYNARSATPEQRARFAKAMYQSIAHRYADGLLQYSTGKLHLVPLQGELNDRRTLVRTEIVDDDGKTIPADYAFHWTSDGGWKFYDVVVEGVSYVTNYRNQVTAEIQKTSLDALIAKLETQGATALDSMAQADGSSL